MVSSLEENLYLGFQMRLELYEQGEEDVKAQLKHLVHVGHSVLIHVNLEIKYTGWGVNIQVEIKIKYTGWGLNIKVED